MERKKKAEDSLIKKRSRSKAKLSVRKVADQLTQG